MFLFLFLILVWALCLSLLSCPGCSLGSYAVLLHGTNKDYDVRRGALAFMLQPSSCNLTGVPANTPSQKAEVYYRRAIAACPMHVNNLGNYALFLADVCTHKHTHGCSCCHLVLTRCCCCTRCGLTTTLPRSCTTLPLAPTLTTPTRCTTTQCCLTA